MLRKIFLLFLTACCLSNETFSSENNNWGYPKNYTTLLAQASVGDTQAQNEICKIIYKGIRRLPSNKNKSEKWLFCWLSTINPDDSFEKRVISLFFNNGDVISAEEIYKEVKMRATWGDFYAQRIMGSFYFYTKLGTDNRREAIEWYEKAASQGHARAQMSLALRYLQGAHLKRDIPQGMKWLVKASDAGLPEAQYTLGCYYLFGTNVKRDKIKGFCLLLSAANNGDDEAQQFLALCRLQHNDPMILVDKDQCMKWLETATDMGNVAAMFWYGRYLLQEADEENKKQGNYLIKKAAELGSDDAKEFIDSNNLQTTR